MGSPKQPKCSSFLSLSPLDVPGTGLVTLICFWCLGVVHEGTGEVHLLILILEFGEIVKDCCDWVDLDLSDEFVFDCDLATVAEVVAAILEDGIDITATLMAYCPRLPFL